MSQQNKTQLQSAINTDLADNTTGAISAADIRNNFINATDSLLFNSGSQTFDGTLTATAFSGDGSALTGVTGEWDGSLNGNAAITGSLIVSGSSLTAVNGIISNAALVAQSATVNSTLSVGTTLSTLGNLEVTGNSTIGGNTLITGSLTTSGSVVDFTDATAISGSTFSGSFVGDGSGLTGVTGEWDGTLNGNAEITGSLTISDSLDVTNFITASKISINDGGNSVFVGEGAGLNDDGTNNRNVGIGAYSLAANTSGNHNTATGISSLASTTTGNGNTAKGAFSLYSNTTGFNNTAVGYFSMEDNVDGANNTANGYGSLQDNTNGEYNTATGGRSLSKNTTGDNNIAFGYDSGRFITGGSTANAIANNSVYLGSLTKAKANNETNQIVIGYDTTGNGSNTVTIGNSSITNNYFNGDVSATSFTGNGATISGSLTASGSVVDFTDATAISGSTFSGSFVGDGSGLTGISSDPFPYTGNVKINGNTEISGSNIDFVHPTLGTTIPTFTLKSTDGNPGFTIDSGTTIQQIDLHTSNDIFIEGSRGFLPTSLGLTTQTATLSGDIVTLDGANTINLASPSTRIGDNSSSTTTMNGIFTTEEYIVSSLPASPATGSRAHVTDATTTTFYSPVTGSGTNPVPVFYNGTDWVIA